VVSQPCYTNAAIMAKHAVSVSPDNITCLIRLDLNRATAQVAYVTWRFIWLDPLSDSIPPGLACLCRSAVWKGFKSAVYQSPTLLVLLGFEYLG